eukprot:498557_1
MAEQKLLLYVLSTLIGLWLLPLFQAWLANDWMWFEGWLFNLSMIILMTITWIYLYFNDPGLLKERYNFFAENQSPKDKIFVKLVRIPCVLLLIILPLDAKRFEWSNNLKQINETYPVIKWIDFIIVIIGEYMIFRSFYDNPFVSPIIRIQKERNHKVIDTGSFGIIRHPMYSGMNFLCIFGSLFIGSFYGFLISLILCGIFLIRIGFEEEMLEKELDGYVQYKQKVKYKLIPFLF